MFKRILVAVDASDTSGLALETALGLAAEANAALRIVHAVDVSNVNLGAEYLDYPQVSESLVKNGRDILATAQARAATAGCEADTGLVVIDSLGQRLPEAIASDADAWAADLIVIGTHGRRGLSRLFLGSIAEGVVRVASQPVLLVKEKDRDKDAGRAAAAM